MFDDDLAALYPKLRARARRRYPGASADDLVQDTCVRALAKRDQFEPGTSLRSWLDSLMHSRYVDQQRAGSRSISTVRWPDEVEQGQPSPAAALWRAIERNSAQSGGQEAIVALREVVTKLQDYRPERRDRRYESPDYATVFLLEAMGYDESEIANRMGIPIGTVKSRKNRGRRLIKGT